MDDEKLWTIAGIISEEETKILEQKPVPTSLVQQKSHMYWPDNLGLHGDRPATNRLIHGKETCK